MLLDSTAIFQTVQNVRLKDAKFVTLVFHWIQTNSVNKHNFVQIYVKLVKILIQINANLVNLDHKCMV